MTNLFEDFLSVVLKLFNAVLNVSKSSVVSPLLWSCFKHLQYNVHKIHHTQRVSYLRIPPPCQLLDSGHIHSPVMQPGPQLRHVLVNEPPVLANCIA